MDIIQIL